MRLGCLDHDPARAAALPLIRYGAAAPPPPIYTPKLDWTPTLGDNDTLPDCIPVALTNSLRAFVKRFGGDTDDLAVPTSAITGLYAHAIGMPGATDAQLAATEGADPLTVMEIAQTQGWDIGAQVPLVPDYGTVAGRVDIARTIATLGACMFAVTLYTSDMDDAAAGRAWTMPPRGSVEGGHMIAAADYLGLADTDILMVPTWGQWQRMSWGWLRPRLRLAMPVMCRELLGPDAAARYDAIRSEAAVGWE